MTQIFSTAAAGLQTSAYQFEKAAQRVVRATAPEDSKDSDPARSVKPGDDLAAAIVDTKVSEIGYKANAAVMRTADKMVGTLLDMRT